MTNTEAERYGRHNGQPLIAGTTYKLAADDGELTFVRLDSIDSDAGTAVVSPLGARLFDPVGEPVTVSLDRLR